MTRVAAGHRLGDGGLAAHDGGRFGVVEHERGIEEFRVATGDPGDASDDVDGARGLVRDDQGAAELHDGDCREGLDGENHVGDRPGPWEPEHVLVGDHLAEQFGGRAPELAAGHGVGAVAEHDGAMAQPPILAKSF